MNATSRRSFLKLLAAGAAGTVWVQGSKFKVQGFALAGTAGTTAAAAAGSAYMANRPFAAVDYSGKATLVDAAGKITWSYRLRDPNDITILPNGNFLTTKGDGVIEIRPSDKETVFSYTAPITPTPRNPNARSEAFAVQRLANGDTFVGECSSGRLLIVAPDGMTVRHEVPLLAKQKTAARPLPGGHGFMRCARVLENGNFLISRFAGGAVEEYDRSGKLVWSAKVPGGAHSVARAANGHTYVSAADFDIRAVGADGKPTGKKFKNPGFYEFDRAGNVVWKVTNDDLPGRPLRFVAGFFVLPNGNFLLCNWVGHGHHGKAPHLLEITRDKKIVWQYDDHKQFRTISNVHPFDDAGKPLPTAGVH